MANPTKPRRRTIRPATTPEGRENQLISLAFDLAQQQLVDGTAPAQIVTHFLKAASARAKLEEEKIKKEILLLSAKVEQIASAERVERLIDEALKAMRVYTGSDNGEIDLGNDH